MEPAALDAASARASPTVTLADLDAISGIHNWKETQAFLRRNLPFEKLALKGAPGWSWNTKLKLWHGPHDHRA